MISVAVTECNPSSAGHMQRSCFAPITHRLDHQRFHTGLGVIVILLDEPGIDDVDDSVDSDGGLSNVGSEDDLAKDGNRSDSERRPR